MASVPGGIVCLIKEGEQLLAASHLLPTVPGSHSAPECTVESESVPLSVLRTLL